jgi:hypothetical protein
MTADDLVPAEVTDLIALVYRADWTALSLAAEVAEYQDHDAYLRMHERRRPPWAPESRPGQYAGPGQSSVRRPRPAPGPAGSEDGPEAEEDEFPAIHERTHRLLLAPGGCFRQETSWDRGSLGVTTSDGHVTWTTGENGPEDLDYAEDLDDAEDIADATDADDDEAWADATEAVNATGEDSAGKDPADGGRFESRPAQPPLDELMWPAWLPAGFELELAGSALAAGRTATRVIGRPRPVGRGSRLSWRSRPRPQHRSRRLHLVDRIDALVDDDLGILLRCERIHGGQVVSRLEITSLTLDPPEASDAGQFTAPEDAANDGRAERIFGGTGWESVKTAADLGATAMSFAIRHAPRREPAGSRPDPADTPAAGGGAWTGQPGPDAPVNPQVLSLIYAAGLRPTEFDAELRVWADSTIGSDAFKWVTRNTTLAGVTRLGDAMGELAGPWQRRDTVRIGLPNRFRIDYIDGGVKRPTVCAEACDGAERWRVFPGHVGVGSAQPYPARIAALVDPAWLLDWRLTGGAEVIEGGRRGFRIRISERWQTSPGWPTAAPVDAVVDAELGILLRLTQEQDGRPAKQEVLAGLRVRERWEASEFRIEIPKGTRVVQDTGGLTDQLDVPAPVLTAVHLAGKAFATAARVGGFLDSVRRQGKGDPGRRP